MVSGSNPLHWDCDARGCFNKKKRPKIEIFAGLFPGRVSFGDVDAIVELNGFALVLEWKGQGAPIKGGQRMMWERLTRDGTITVFVVEGDAETMEVYSASRFYCGQLSECKEMNLDGLKERIRQWVYQVSEAGFNTLQRS